MSYHLLTQTHWLLTQFVQIGTQPGEAILFASKSTNFTIVVISIDINRTQLTFFLRLLDSALFLPTTLLLFQMIATFTAKNVR